MMCCRSKIVIAIALAISLPAEAVVKAQSDLSEAEENKLDSDLWAYFSAGLLINWFPESISGFGGDLVGDAEIRGTTVRVKTLPSATASIGLQAFVPVFERGSVKVSDDASEVEQLSKWGIGPYVGVGLGSDKIIETVALGAAWSYRRKELGIRIGVGAVADPLATFLSEEFTPGGAIPEGAEAIEFLKRPTAGVQLMVTFTPGF